MKKVRLGDIYSISSGGTPSRKNLEYYSGGTINWVKTGDLKKKYIEETEEKITDKGLYNSSTKMYNSGTVLIAMYGATIGETSILNIKACTNQACAAFVKNNKVIPEYLYYFFKSNKEKFVNAGIGGAQPNISIGYLKNVLFNLYEISEQEKIVNKLNKLEEIIDLRKKQIEVFDEFIKSQFIQMFGNPFDNSKWKIKKLGEVAESIYDGTNIPPKYYQKEEKVLFLRIQNVWRNEFRLEDSVYVSEEINKKYIDTSLKKGDLLITKIGRYYTKESSLGRVAIYLGENNKANYSNNIMRIRVKNEIDSEFLNILLNLEDYQLYIRRESNGGTDKRALSKKVIEKFPIIIPPLEMQNQFIKFVKQINNQKLIIEKSLKDTEELQDSLMNKYFGE